MAKVYGKCYLQQLNTCISAERLFRQNDNNFDDRKQKIILQFRIADDDYDDDNCGYIWFYCNGAFAHYTDDAPNTLLNRNPFDPTDYTTPPSQCVLWPWWLIRPNHVSMQCEARNGIVAYIWTQSTWFAFSSIFFSIFAFETSCSFLCLFPIRALRLRAYKLLRSVKFRKSSFWNFLTVNSQFTLIHFGIQSKQNFKSKDKRFAHVHISIWFDYLNDWNFLACEFWMFLNFRRFVRKKNCNFKFCVHREEVQSKLKWFFYVPVH